MSTIFRKITGKQITRGESVPLPSDQEKLMHWLFVT